MVNFLDALKAESEKIETNDSNERDTDIPSPKNPIIRVNGKYNGVKTPTLMLRILPSFGLVNGQEGASLGVRQRSIFFDLKTPKQTLQNRSVTLPREFDLENDVEKHVQKWTAEGYKNRLATEKYGFSSISSTYWMPALLLSANQQGGYDMVLNEQGQPKVFAFNIGFSGYDKLLKLVSNPNYSIDGDSFISFGKSFPIEFSKDSQTAFGVNIFANKILPPIDPQVIVPQLEDFQAITEPMDVQQPHWWKSIKGFMDLLDGAEETAGQAPQPGFNYKDPFLEQQQQVYTQPNQAGVQNTATYPGQAQGQGQTVYTGQAQAQGQPTYPGQAQPQGQPVYPAQPQGQPMYPGQAQGQGQPVYPAQPQGQTGVINTGNAGQGPLPDPFNVAREQAPQPTPVPENQTASLGVDQNGADLDAVLNGILGK